MMAWLCRMQPLVSGLMCGVSACCAEFHPCTTQALVPELENLPEDNTLFLFFFSGHGIHVADQDCIIPKQPGDRFTRGPQRLPARGRAKR
jgi:hypothetical protein